jgi:uncharacterized protein
LNEDDNTILFGEVKWSINKIGLDILVDLKRKAFLVEWGKMPRKEYYALFSRSGFTQELLQAATNEGLLLCALEDVGI